MSKKHRGKLKRKHGERLVELDFLSPLTPDECISHLKSGRSPLRALQLKVEADPNNDVQVAWTDRLWQWEGVWYAGTLEQGEDGLTRVHGFIMSDYGSTGQTAFFDTLTLLGSASAILTVALLILVARYQNFIFVYAWGVVMATVGFYFYRRKLHLDQLSSHLSDYIDERLNVQRTTLHEHTTD
jgi:hypothetical protein